MHTSGSIGVSYPCSPETGVVADDSERGGWGGDLCKVGRRYTSNRLRGGTQVARFDERPLHWTDILGRFEAHSHQTHIHSAMGLIGGLKDIGRNFWPEGSPQLSRWEEGCTELWSFLNRLGTRHDLNKQDLATAFREFIQEFEHTTYRMYQMLYGTVADPNNNDSVTHVFDWFNLVFRSSTYALVSRWLNDKQEQNLVHISIDMASGESSEDWTRTEMKVPQKYQRATKRL